jgi:hypothetical protein
VQRSLYIIARTFPTKGKQTRTHPLRANKRGHTHCGHYDPSGTTARAETSGRRNSGSATKQDEYPNSGAYNSSSEVEPMITEISALITVMAAPRQRRYTRSFATRATTATQYQIIWKFGSAATCICLERNCAVGPPRSLPC